jgi:hypothetical protein
MTISEAIAYVGAQDLRKRSWLVVFSAGTWTGTCLADNARVTANDWYAFKAACEAHDEAAHPAR